MFIHPLHNNRGVALIFMVLFFTAAATAAITFIAMGLKVKGIQEEGTTQQRLAEIQAALQNYYLIHYDLPNPTQTSPANAVPVTELNLPQKFRYDANGQRIQYYRQNSLTQQVQAPPNGHMASVRNIQVNGSAVAAALVAPGPNKILDSTVPPASPFAVTSAGDDLVVAVSLEAEALKIANHTVAVLQQAARAYDQQFCDPSAPDPQDAGSQCTAINNDADTLFLPPVDRLNNDGSWDPGTEWYDYTPPVQERAVFDCSGGANSGEWDPSGSCYVYVGSTLGVPNGSCTRTDISGSNIWYPNYAGQTRYVACSSGNVYPNGTVPVNDEDVVPRPITAGNPTPPVTDADMRPLERPVPLIDEVEQDTNGDGLVDWRDAFIEAAPNLYSSNPGRGCVWLGILSNDPSRGTASLDNCSSGTPGYDLAVAYGLNLVKLGYNQDTVNPALLDPWGNRYLWGASGQIYPSPLYDPIRPDINIDGSYDQDDDVLRDPHYWTFYSRGPDGLPALGADGRPNTGDENTPDDILPPADRIPGFFITPQIPNPIP